MNIQLKAVTDFFKDLFTYSFMCVCFTYIIVCVSCTCGTCGDQKRAADLLKLELQPVVRHPASAGKCVYLEKQPLLLTIEPSLQFHDRPLLLNKRICDIKWALKLET